MVSAALTVYVALEHVEEAKVGVVGEACRRAAARLQTWERGGPFPVNNGAPALLLAELKRGQRKIPPELHRTLSHPGLRLVLLCNEPLADGTTTLRRGRVTLLAPPHSPEAIATELRGFPAPAPPAPPPPSAAPAAARRPGVILRSREQLRRRFWIARLTVAEPAPATEPRFPLVHQRSGEGAAVFVRGAAKDGLSDNDLAQLAVQLAREPGRLTETYLEERLGDELGMVMLAEGTLQWHVYWPFAGPVWLASPRRAPSFWELAGGLRGRLVTLRAYPDDVLAALSAPIAAGPNDAALEAAAAGGGPDLLEHLEGRLRARPTTLSAALVMAR